MTNIVNVNHSPLVTQFPRSINRVVATRKRLHRRGKVESSLPQSVPCAHLDKELNNASGVASYFHSARIISPIS
jgi:hypothetical protein